MKPKLRSQNTLGECQPPDENWRLLAKRVAIDVVVAVISTLIAAAMIALAGILVG